jgi:hypothetical protein
MSEPTIPDPRPDRVFEADTFTEVVTDAAVAHPEVVAPPPPPSYETWSVDSLQIFDVTAEPADGA